MLVAEVFVSFLGDDAADYSATILVYAMAVARLVVALAALGEM
jgi:hypothetical protein